MAPHETDHGRDRNTYLNKKYLEFYQMMLTDGNAKGAPTTDPYRRAERMQNIIN